MIERKIIAGCLRFEAIARLAEQRLAKDPLMNVADFSTLLGKIGWSTAEGTKAMMRLDLPRGEADPMKVLFDSFAVPTPAAISSPLPAAVAAAEPEPALGATCTPEPAAGL